MPLNILKQINWLDVCIFVLIVRILYISLKTGFSVEVFKLLGTVAAVLLSLHYYVSLSNLVIEYLNIKDTPEQVVYFAIIVILATIGYLLFVGLRNLVYHYVKIDSVSNTEKWGGLVLGIARAVLLASLVTFVVVLTNIKYFKSSVKDAYSQKYLFRAAPDTYTWIWQNAISKIPASGNYNQDITRIESIRKEK
jgi:uncharacterized membrane protein required for colicin V production